jgi:endonuclease/exonuclease/phosphatase family metal-dependent hydrolase
MRIASYNVENLFDRAKALNEDSAEAQKAIKLESELNTLFQKSEYTTGDKERMLTIMSELGIRNVDEGPFVILRKNRGNFVKRKKNGVVEIVANGRGDWVGWVEHKTVHVNDIAILNTGRVMKDVDADIIAVIEAEHRIALKQFSDYVLKNVGGRPYPNVMLIDGNDPRGIDVGIMTKANYNIGSMRSHVHDLGPGQKPIFSRDCPEYCVETPNGEKIWVLPNHFKSKFGGNNTASQDKRKEQSKRTAAIYQRLISEGHLNVVVLGDLNDTPDSKDLKPLLVGTDLKDVSDHPLFDTGEFPGKGTFGLGNDKDKIDYILLSPALFERVTACGLFRKGAWPGKRPRWTVYDELETEAHVASDHHLVWCDIQ